MASPDPEAQAAYLDKVLEQLFSLSVKVESLRKIQAQKSGLPLAAFNLLLCVAGFEKEGCTVSQAAAQLGIRPQALNTPAALLDKQGLLKREKDRIDSRAKRLTITSLGGKKILAADELLEELKQELAHQIPAANVASLILSRLELGATRVIEQNQEPELA
jgi:DNA-binding MarR family transcriptional regulator